MIVVDASLAVEILLRTPLGAQHTGQVVGQDVHAPHLIDIELANTLRRLTRGGRLSEATAQAALADMQAWHMQRHGHVALLQRIWSLRNSVSAYDASYVALAEILNAPLMTCDAKLSRSHGHHANIVLLS